VVKAPDNAVPLGGTWVAVLCAAVLCLLVLGFGCFPSWLVSLMENATATVGH